MRPGTEDFETALLELIGECEVPAALMCVSKNGQIVFNRAYGWLNLSERKPLRTNARIGLASLDKIITSTAIELLCKRRIVIPGTKLPVSKGQRPFDVFRQLGLGPADGTVRDERLFQVTVEHLLKHEGGLSESVHQGEVVERELQLKRLPTPSDSIAYLFHMPLKRDPGTQHEYNSAGYFVLRFLIDLAGGGFIPFLKRSVFGPAGTKDSCLSRARPADRDPLEVRYLCAIRGPSIFPEDHGRVIPEIDGRNGRYVDNHLVLATSAEAVVRYLDYRFFGSADRLWSSARAASLRDLTMAAAFSTAAWWAFARACNNGAGPCATMPSSPTGCATGRATSRRISISASRKSSRDSTGDGSGNHRV